MAKLLSIQFIFCLISGLVYSQTGSQTELVLLDSISSPYNDSSPKVNPQNGNLIFSRTNRNGDKDLIEAQWKGNYWVPKNNTLTQFNNRYDNEVFHFDSDNNIFFQKAILDPAGRAIFGIFESRYENGGWSDPVKQNIKYFNNKSQDQSFCLSQDKNVMIISMQSYFSYGVEDLYVSFRVDKNQWTEPQNLGSSINTKFEEFTPFLDTDSRTLYFSSNGHKGGYGSKDIWVSYRLDSSWTNWTEPKNLGPKVNTIGMELSFEKTGLNSIPYLVVSTRSSDGQSDIFGLRHIEREVDSIINLIKPVETSNNSDSSDQKISAPDSLPITNTVDTVKVDTSEGQLLENNKNKLSLNVLNKESGNGIPASIVYKSKTFSDSVNLQKDSVLTLNFEWLDTVEIEVRSKNFMSQNKRIIFENAHFGIHLRETITLDSLEIGKAIKFEHVLFKRGTPELLNESFSDLNYVTHILNENPDLNIEIAGHTDNSGNAYLNYILSEKRAKTIKSYLVDKGIEPARISTVGHGGSKPIASNDNEETMKLNRRVEFKLIRNQE